MTHDLTEETEIAHKNRKSADECALMLLIGNMHHKALWETGTGRYVKSYDCYQSIYRNIKQSYLTAELETKLQMAHPLKIMESVILHL